MKAELIPEETYTLKIGNYELHGLKRTGTWEGFSKFTHPKGMIIVDHYPRAKLNEIFRDIFGTTENQSEPVQIEILKASPEILAEASACSEGETT